MSDEAVDRARRTRAEARRERIRIVKASLDDTTADACPPLRGEAAVALAWELSRVAWRLSGRQLPDVPRHELPYRFIPASRRRA